MPMLILQICFVVILYGNFTLLCLGSSLKEDAPLDVSTTLTPTQILLVWTLLSILLVWLVVFTFLALRPTSREIEVVNTTPDHPPLRTAPGQHKLAPSLGSLSQTANDVETVRVG